MRMSRYLRVRERDGWIAAFHELHPDPIYCPSEEWSAFVHNPSDSHRLYTEAIRRKLFVASASEDDAEFASVSQELDRKLSEPTVLYLMLARGCNFGCAYCPVPRLAATYGDAYLSMEDARSGLELWSKHLKGGSGGECFIIFYGGEPLLNKPTFFSALEDIRRMRKDGRLPAEGVHLMLATNGTLIDDGVLAACLEHDVLVALGLDGPRSANDRLRRYADGRGSFDDIVKNLRLLRKHGVRTAVSASITPDSVGTIDELDAILRDLGVVKFGLNFLKGRALAELVPAEGRSAFEQASALAVASRHKKLGGDGFEYQVEKKVEAFRQRDFYPVDCTCYGNQVVIRADGHVANCPFTEEDLGHVSVLDEDFRIAETEIVHAWRKRLSLHHPAFQDNDAKSLCGPGCAWGAHDLTGDVLAPDTMLTSFSRDVFEELIWSEFPGGINGQP